MLFEGTDMAEGRRSLLQAALRLSQSGRSITDIGIRELTRAAGLNSNTFYRHFADMDALGLTLVAALHESLRKPMRELRYKAAQYGNVGQDWGASGEKLLLAAIRRVEHVNHITVKLLFDFVEEHPETVSLVVREQHGPSPVLRQAVRAYVAECARDIAEGIRTLQLAPMLDDERIDELATLMNQQMLALSLDYVEQPEQRAAIRRQAEDFNRALSIGLLAQQDIPAAVMTMALDAYRAARQQDAPEPAALQG